MLASLLNGASCIRGFCFVVSHWTLVKYDWCMVHVCSDGPGANACMLHLWWCICTAHAVSIRAYSMHCPCVALTWMGALFGSSHSSMTCLFIIFIHVSWRILSSYMRVSCDGSVTCCVTKVLYHIQPPQNIWTFVFFLEGNKIRPLGLPWTHISQLSLLFFFFAGYIYIVRCVHLSCIL